ncbi:amino acid transport GAP1 [Fusarium agapanthi]|uniref:Amino acid transport GAP1 n=1 Tax=Fusarium agapanthi TaxID=1803897 RepID=A0A9P5ECB0_9HYPO|nr:amino acid transport GAP1 [Fusarium agapanthi]
MIRKFELACIFSACSFISNMAYQREFEMQALPPSPKSRSPEPKDDDSSAWSRLITSFSRAPARHGENDSLSSYNSYAFNGRLFNIRKANYNSANTALARELKNRHLQMIAFGGSIGTGLFVASGVALYRGGPVSLLLAFITMGAMQFFTMQALGELSVAFPVGGSFANYSTRFLDPSWGFAMGWNYTLQYLIVLPLEIIAGAFTTNYWNPNASKSIFIALFFILILGINLLGVKAYGEAEFIFSAVKVTAIVGFILLGIIINIAGSPEGDYIGFTRWHNPGSFHNGFKGFASVLVTATFSFAGTEMVGLAAAETSNPKKSIPAAVKQVFWRISLFYILSILLIGLLVPYNEPRLLGAKYGSDAAASPFVIAIEMSGSEVLPDIMNAVILISLISVGNTAVYAASRTLAALAEQSLAPKMFAYIDRTGRPLVAIICCGLLGLLAFTANSKIHNEIFNWLLAISGLSTLFTWSSICVCHIRFRKAWQLSGYNVSQLAFRSQVGVWGSWVALAAYGTVLVLQIWVAISPIQAEGEDPLTIAERFKNFFLQILTIPIIFLFYFTHRTWVGTKVYIRLKAIVTFIRLINYLFTRPHFTPSPTCTRKPIRIPSRDLNRFINAWIYYPTNYTDTKEYGLVINWHGGAYTLPNLGMDHQFCEKLATEINVLVLDADYRKAPEYPLPGAVEDAEDIFRWVESQAQMFDLDRVALSGFSSGGNLALVASSELRREFKMNIRAVYAFYPGVDFSIPPEEKTIPEPIRPLPVSFQHLLTEAYIPRVEDRKSPKASPMHAEGHSFPKHIMLVACSGDIFTPEIEVFGKKLERAGRDVEIVRIEGAHGCDKTTNPRTFRPEARDFAYAKPNSTNATMNAEGSLAEMKEYEAISVKLAQLQKAMKEEKSESPQILRESLADKEGCIGEVESEMRSLQHESMQTSEKKNREALPITQWTPEWYKCVKSKVMAITAMVPQLVSLGTVHCHMENRSLMFRPGKLFLANSSPFYNHIAPSTQHLSLSLIKVIKSSPMMASNHKYQHYEMLGASLWKLYETGMFSDLIITCGDDVHKVHKAIVCPRSSFFTVACSGNFKEALEGRIDLPDDDPHAVRDMIYYLYNLNLVGYEFVPEDGNFFEEELSTTEHDDELKQFLESQGHRFVGNRRVKSMAPKLGVHIGPSSNLCLFAKVYAMGEKYGIPGLKLIALTKFEKLAKAYAHTEDFRLAVEEVYTSTIDEDRGMRDVVASTVEDNMDLLDDEAFESLVKNTELGYDLLMKTAAIHLAGMSRVY